MNKKGYEVIELRALERFVQRRQEELAVCILHWLIQGLHSKLGDRLQDVELEVIPVQYLGGPYPALGLHYKRSPDPELGSLVETVAIEILRQQSVADFLAGAPHDASTWAEIADHYKSDCAVK